MAEPLAAFRRTVERHWRDQILRRRAALASPRSGRGAAGRLGRTGTGWGARGRSRAPAKPEAARAAAAVVAVVDGYQVVIAAQRERAELPAADGVLPDREGRGRRRRGGAGR